MKKILPVAALLFCTQAIAEQPEKIILSCDLSGKEEITSSKFPSKNKKISGTITYVIEKNSQNYWTIREGDQSAVRTQYDLESVKDNDKELYYSASVNVNEHLISEETQRRIPSHMDKNGEEQPIYWFSQKTTINRISGQISYQSTVDTKHSSGFTSKNFRDLSGICKAAANQF